jgi:hypothetical protein
MAITISYIRWDDDGDVHFVLDRIV